MRGWRALFVVLGVAFAVACIPGRNNPRDPVNAPEVIARVVDYTSPDGSCPAYSSSSAGSVVTSASHARCLAIDASESTDADGAVLAANGRYTFFRPGEETPAQGPGPLPYFVIDSALRFAVQESTLARFPIVVDGGGGHSVGEAVVLLLDSQPVAISPAPRTLGVHGFPWAPDQPMTLEFDPSRSFDVDGDAFQACWTMPGQQEVCGTSGDLSPYSTAVPIATPGTFIATLRLAQSGGRSSDPVEARVAVGRPNLWFVPEANTTGIRSIERLDSGLRNFAANVQATDGSAKVIAATSVRGASGAPAFVVAIPYAATGTPTPSPTPFAGGTPAAGIIIASGPTQNGTLDEEFVAPFALKAVMGTDPAGGRLALLAPSVFTLRDVNRGTLTEVVTRNAPELFDAAGGFDGEIYVTVDELGAGWIATPSGLVDRIDETGAELLLAQDARRAGSGIAARPGAEEVWLSSIPAPASGTGPAPAAGIDVFDAATLESHHLASIDAAGILGLAWRNHDTLWIASAEGGLRLVDAALLEAGVPLAAATLVFADVPGIVLGLRVDPLSGSCYGRSVDPLSGVGAVYRVTTEGGVDLFAATSPIGPLAVLADGSFLSPPSNVAPSTPTPTLPPTGTATPTPPPVGSLLTFTTVIGVDVGLAPSDNGVVSHAVGAMSAVPAVDPLTGGLWLPVSVPVGLAHVDETGHTNELLTAFADGEPIPKIERWRLSPGGKTGWHDTLPVVTPTPKPGCSGSEYKGSASRIDLSTRPPGKIAGTFDDMYVFPASPSAPLWAATTDTCGNLALGTLDPQAADGDAFQVASGPAASVTGLGPANVSVSLPSNDLCGYNGSFLRIGQDGSVQTMGDGGGLGFQVASGPGDLCWFVADGAPGRFVVEAFDASGTLVHAVTGESFDAGRGLSSFAPIDENALWVALDVVSPPPGTHPASRKFLLDLSASTMRELPATQKGTLLRP